MMAPKRFVLVRGSSAGWCRGRWRGVAEGVAARPLAEYVAEPNDCTCMVLVAAKLDGRRKLSTVAKKNGLLVTCEALDDRALVEWVLAQAKERGNPMDREVAELLGQIAGPSSRT